MKRALISAGLAIGAIATSPLAMAQEDYIGEIFMTGANFCPRGTALADGQLLPISQNTALFSLLGTTYGGDGRTTFALPDLRGRAPVHQGRGPGLTDRRLGERFGSEQTTLTISNLPSHNHAAEVRATGKSVAAGSEPLATLAPDGEAAAGVAVGNAGGSQPFNTQPPSLVMNFCVVLQGIYPSRG